MIDIIMPAYNAEKFIIQTLNRLEKQTFKDFRLIIVNDGSIDRTQKLVEEFIFSTKMEIKLINQKNLGEGEARNTGLKNSDKKYILFLDCDDYLRDDALQIFYKTITENNSDIVVSNYYQVDTNEKILKKYKQNESKMTDKNLIIKKMLTKEILIGIGIALIDSNLIKENELFFNNYKYGADFNFFCKLVLYLKKVIFIPEELFYYVQNPTSVMHQKFSYSRLDAIESIKNIEKYYFEKNLSDRYKKEISYAYNIELIGVYNLYLKNYKNGKEIKEIKEILSTKRKISLSDFIKIEHISKNKVFLFLFSTILYKNIYLLFLFFNNIRTYCIQRRLDE